ncbi:MAG TPA: hypothetical protein VFP84_16675 [Kofleriaceae bacterium]|nr:hypothetical protein [Kofleriaceae bacterium]
MLGCKSHASDRNKMSAGTTAASTQPPRPVGEEAELQVLGESSRLRIGDATPATHAWFDGFRIVLTAARGEILGLQVVHAGGGKVSVQLADGARVGVRGYAVEPFVVLRPSTALYGGSHGAGLYPDGLLAAAEPTSDPAYFELEVGYDAEPGTYTGALTTRDRSVPIELHVAPVTLPPLPLKVWAYENTLEPLWSNTSERACVAMFARYGVLLSPDVHLEDWPTRRAQLGDAKRIRDVPVWISEYPPIAYGQVKAWIDAFRGTGQVPFAIPIDEPRTPEARRRVRALADTVRAAGGGPTTFRFAVTDAPDPIYGDAVDLYISWNAAHLRGDPAARWTYNGAPPYAGSMVLDAESPGMRTWGWIAWRYQIPIWYVWDALYWHDRHNRKQLALPIRGLDARRDAVSFDDGEDHGNLDGVLALPGCEPTLRLAQLRRGFQDFQLLELAAKCDRKAADAVAAELVPRALGDAVTGAPPAWPTTETTWETAREKLIAIAASCAAR